MNEQVATEDKPTTPAPEAPAAEQATPTMVNERREACGCNFIDWSNGGKNVEPCLAHGLGSMHNAMKQVIAALTEFNRLLEVTAQMDLMRAMNKPKLSVVRGAAAERVLGRKD